MRNNTNLDHPTVTRKRIPPVGWHTSGTAGFTMGCVAQWTGLCINGDVETVAWVKDPEKAALIVRAMNAHDELVTALQTARALIALDIVRDDAGCLAKIDAALAKVTPS